MRCDIQRMLLFIGFVLIHNTTYSAKNNININLTNIVSNYIGHYNIFMYTNECLLTKELFIMSDDYVTDEGGVSSQDILTNTILLEKRIIEDNNHGEERIRPGVSLLGFNMNATKKTKTNQTNTEATVATHPNPLPPTPPLPLPVTAVTSVEPSTPTTNSSTHVLVPLDRFRSVMNNNLGFCKECKTTRLTIKTYATIHLANGIRLECNNCKRELQMLRVRVWRFTLMATSMSSATVSERRSRRAIVDKLRTARKRMESLLKTLEQYKIDPEQNSQYADREHNGRRNSVSYELNLRLMLSAYHVTYM